MSGNFLSRHELKRNNISRIISRDASVNQWRLLNTFKPTETEKEENHRYHKRSLHVSETERSWMETTSEHLKMFRKKWAKNVGLKGNGMEAICELPEITALQRYHGNSCNWAGSWGGFTQQTFGTVLFCPDISNLQDIGKRSILKKEAVPLYSETNDLGSRKSMDVEMREPWAMKQAHKNVAYKWNRTERSLISKINKGRDARAMSNEAST